MPSSRALTRASRETCFSALSWRSAPTKSRLIMCLPVWCGLLCSRGSADTKKRGLVTHVPRRPCAIEGEYTPGSVHPQSAPGSPGPARTSTISAAGDGSDGRRGDAVAPVHVGLQQVDELGHDVVTAQGPVELPVDEDRRDRRLEGARQADPDVGVLRLARAVDDTAHHGDLHVLDAGVGLLPLGHPALEVVGDLLGHLLKE